MQDQYPDHVPSPIAAPCEMPLPESGSSVNGVLYLFEPCSHARDNAILSSANDYGFVAEGADDCTFLRDGWLLMSNDRKAIAHALMRWDAPDWSVDFVRDENATEGRWELGGALPGGMTYEVLSDDGEPDTLTDPSMDISAVKDAFLEGIVDRCPPGKCEARGG